MKRFFSSFVVLFIATFFVVNNVNAAIDKTLSNRLSGYFLSQNESGSKIWYVGTKDKKRYYISTPDDLKNVIQNNSITLNSKTANYYIKTKFPSTYYGKFVIDQTTKKTYYIDPKTKKYIEVKNDYKTELKNIAKIALGIKNSDIEKINNGTTFNNQVVYFINFGEWIYDPVFNKSSMRADNNLSHVSLQFDAVMDKKSVENRLNYTFKDINGNILNSNTGGIGVDNDGHPVNNPVLYTSGAPWLINKMVNIKLGEKDDCNTHMPKGKYILEVRNLKIVDTKKKIDYIQKMGIESLDDCRNDNTNNSDNNVNIYNFSYRTSDGKCVWGKITPMSNYLNESKNNNVIDIYRSTMLFDNGDVVRDGKILINVNDDSFNAIKFIMFNTDVVNKSSISKKVISNDVCVMSDNGSIKCLSRNCSWDSPCDNGNKGNLMEDRVDLMGAKNILGLSDQILYYSNGDIKEKTLIKNGDVYVFSNKPSILMNNKPENIKFISSDFIIDQSNVIYGWSGLNNKWVKHPCSDNIPSGEILNSFGNILIIKNK